MFTRVLCATLFFFPVLSFAETSLEEFFGSLTGKWHGEVAGIYKVDLEASAFEAKQPWLLQSGTIKIEEGDTTIYAFELSKNESLFDREPVYFLQLKDEKETQIYTLTQRAKSSRAFSFWRHTTVKANEEEFITANGIKFFKENGKLVLSIVSGNGYCKANQQVRHCATDGYRPFQMQKVTR